MQAERHDHVDGLTFQNQREAVRDVQLEVHQGHFTTLGALRAYYSSNIDPEFFLPCPSLISALLEESLQSCFGSPIWPGERQICTSKVIAPDHKDNIFQTCVSFTNTKFNCSMNQHYKICITFKLLKGKRQSQNIVVRDGILYST